MPEPPDSVAGIAHQLRIALESADLSEFADLLDPKVSWGSPGDPAPLCQNRKQVLAWYERGRDAGVRARVTDVEIVVGDRILVKLVLAGTDAARERGGRAIRWQVYTVRDGRIVDIAGFDQRGEAADYATGSMSSG